MNGARAPRLASRLLLTQLMVVAIGAITPVIAAAVFAPRLFHLHLREAGVNHPDVLAHAESAFQSALGPAVALGVLMSLGAAGAVSWYLVRRITAPIEQLAEAAQDIAAGMYDVGVPAAAFSRELNALAESFAQMAERLAEAGATRTRLLADLAHEVRTPLAALQAYIDGMEDGVICCDAAAWQTMRHQIDRLRRLAEDIREVARAEEQPLDLQTLDPFDAVNAAVLAAMPRYMRKGVTLELEPCAARAAVDGDSLRLQQVVANLLDNALRHTPPGGRVTVSASVTAGRFSAAVMDTGDGLPATELDAIFERLHRVDPARASSDGSGGGLGLTIARAIARAHGGTLTARSEGLGSGSVFTLHLPLAERRAAAAVRPPV